MSSTIAKIDLNCLRHNILEYQNLLGDTTKMILVIKADGYGHGAVPIAKIASQMGIGFFAVSRVKEGIELVEAGIEGTIIILGGALPSDMEIAVEHGLVPTIYSIDQLRQLEASSKKRDTKHSFHLKIETGMNRMGIRIGENLEGFLDALDDTQHVRLSGVYSHLATSDSDPEYTKKQYKEFAKSMRQIRDRDYSPKTHISNSAAIAAYNYCRLDYVRLGIGLYGLRPDSRENVDLQPVMSLVSPIVHINDVEMGDTISYGRTYTAPHSMRIAVLPIGYADGYPRILSNRGQVLVRGTRCDIVGRVCMDHIMVDVTEVEDAQIGDEVVLIGKQGDKEILAKELADMCDTIHYEIVAGIQKRVDRVYVGV